MYLRLINRTMLCLLMVSYGGPLFFNFVQAEELNYQEALGKRIYTEGINSLGETYDAVIGEADITLPSSTLPCAGCHGDRAEGGEEGGVRPPPLAWSHLTKHYGHIHGNGRRHPAFTEASFAESLRQGHDPAGNRLDTTMPRFHLSDEDIEALISYLKWIPSESADGVTETVIRLGTLVPRTGRLANTGDSILSALGFLIDRINSRGGLFGRKLELVVASYEENRQSTLENLEKMLREQSVFALVSPFFVGIEDSGAELSARYKVPVVGPYSQIHSSQDSGLDYLFYLRSGFREQARALIRYHDSNVGTKSSILIVRPSGVLDGVIESIKAEATDLGWVSRDYPIERARRSWDDLVAREVNNNDDLVLFYGTDQDLTGFLTAADLAGWYPSVMVPEALIGSNLFNQPLSFSERIFLTHPDPVGKSKFRPTRMMNAFLRSESLNRVFLETQLAALNAIQVTDEGLRRAGRELTRDKFVQAVESLTEWDSSIGPNISFSANRRVASQGSRIVSVDINDRSYRLVSDWFEID